MENFNTAKVRQAKRGERTMQAMVVSGYGEPLRPYDLPVPSITPEHHRIRVHACSVNFADLLMQSGQYQERPDLPFAPGMEICGTVEDVAQISTGIDRGQRVAAYCGYGGMAEHVSVPAAACLPVPDKMPDHVAAAFPIVYGTSHIALSHGARLQPGDRLLVLGAAGGLGMTSVEVGKLMGAEVVAAARGSEHLAAADRAGADHLIDTAVGPDEIISRVKALGGADVVIDPVGGDQFDAALRACRPGARLVPLGFASGKIPQIPANILLVKNLSVIGLYWGAFAKLWPSAIAESFATLLNWYSAGQLHPHVSHRFPIDQANDALELLRSRKAVGKVVVTLLPESVSGS